VAKQQDLLSAPSEDELKRSDEALLAAPTPQELSSTGEASFGDVAGAAVRGIGRGVLFGQAETVAQLAGERIEGIGRLGGQAALAAGVDPETLSQANIPFASDVGLEAQGFDIGQQPFGTQVAGGIAAQTALDEEIAPVASLGGEIVGNLITGGGLAAAGKAAIRSIIGQVAPGLLAKAEVIERAGRIGFKGAKRLNLGVKVASNAAEAAALTALEAGTSSNDVAGSAKLATAFTVAPAAVKGLFKAGAKLGKGAFAAAFGIKGPAAKKLMDRAQEIRKLPDFDDVVEQTEKAVDELRVNAAKTQEEVGGELLNALTGIKQRAVDLSAEAFGILDESTKRFSKVQLLRTLQKAGDAAPVGTAGRGMKVRMKQFINDVDEFVPADKDGALTGSQVKKIIQDLDSEIGEINAKAGQILTPTERLMTQARRAVDQTLKKNVPEYAQAMEEVAALTTFISTASKKLGDVDKAISASLRVGAPVEKEATKLVKELAKRSNVDIARLKTAQETANLFKSWNTSNFDRKVRALTRGLNPNDRAQLKAIASVSDDEFVRAVENLQISNEFEKEFLRGSRNVNLWSFLGFGLSQGNPIALAAGAASGGLIDKFGPKMAKSVLLAVGEIKGAITIPKIRKMNLPGNVTDFLEDQFRRTIVFANTGNDVTIDDDAKQGVMLDIEGSKVLTPLQKATMITQIQRDGEVDASLYKKLVSGSDKPDFPQPNLSFIKKAPTRSAPNLEKVAAGVRPLIKDRKPPDY